jgi:hypothetical protein
MIGAGLSQVLGGVRRFGLAIGFRVGLRMLRNHRYASTAASILLHHTDTLSNAIDSILQLCIRIVFET